MKYAEYNERKQHGTTDFPVEYYYVTKDYPQYIMPLHWHSEFEIIRIISGHFSLFLNNVQYEMDSGDFALIDCLTLHRGTPNNCIYECLVFDANMLRSKTAVATDSYVVPLLNHTSGVASLYGTKNNDVSTVLSELFNSAKNRPVYYELEIISLLFRLVFLLYSQNMILSPKQSRYNIRQTKKIAELLDWIDAHYTEQITLTELAKISGFKEKYLCRLFKEYTSRTPVDYINRLRIDNACRDLTHAGCSVTEAAFNNGFNDLSYFSKKFKHYKNISPRAFSKKQNNSVVR